MGKDDASEELFTAPFQSVTDWNASASFQERMKLEAIDPLNLSAICAATVKKVLVVLLCDSTEIFTIKVTSGREFLRITVNFTFQSVLWHGHIKIHLFPPLPSGLKYLFFEWFLIRTPATTDGSQCNVSVVQSFF